MRALIRQGQQDRQREERRTAQEVQERRKELKNALEMERLRVETYHYRYGDKSKLVSDAKSKTEKITDPQV